MQARLTWKTPQKFWSDFVPSCFPYQKETFGKVLVLILMGRISSIIWVIWVGSDIQADTNFQVRFYVMMFPDHSAVFARIEMGKVIPTDYTCFQHGIVETFVLFCISSLMYFILAIFKKKIDKSNKQYNEPVVCYCYIRRIILQTRPPNQNFVAMALELNSNQKQKRKKARKKKNKRNLPIY